MLESAFKTGTPGIAVIILTLNEEANLPACLESLQDLNCDIFVVDSGSTDETEQIARSFGAVFVHHRFETQAQQLNWALDNLVIEREWILRLDADERLTSDLALELKTKIHEFPAEVCGLFIKRRVYFMGRWIRHGGYYPTWLLRAWRNGRARCETRVMDEHMILSRGIPQFLKGDIWEENRKALKVWVERQNGYSTREALAIHSTESGKDVDVIKPSLFGTPEARRRWLKYYGYMPVPPFVRAFLYFSWRYFVRLGFLDGKPGLIFHFLQGCWYRFLVDAKLYEMKAATGVSGKQIGEDPGKPR